MAIRILHLEDDSVDAELVQATLALEGLNLTIVRVASRAEFEAALQMESFDLILADFSLPGYDGLAALDLAQAVRPDVPFIYVTGVLGEEQAIETLKRGATDYVYKSRLAALGPAVRRALREAQVRAERQRAQTAVQAEREWLRVTLSSIGDAVIATDTEGRVTFMNAVAEALTGWPQAEAAGRPIAEVFQIVSEGTFEPVESPVLQAIRNGAIVGLANHTLLITRSGARLPIDDSAAPIRDVHGNLIGVVLVFRDITDRRQAEATLEARARQQAAVAELGHRALASRDLQQLMDEVVNRVARTLDVEFSKVLELQPDGEYLLIRAGVGWKPGVVGETLVDVQTHSQAGYTLHANTPVLVENLRAESRFVGMPVLHEHGIVSGMTVVIPGPQRPFGVLGAHTAARRQFSPDDAHFLQAVANVLAEAIARQRVEDSLRSLTLRLDRALVEAELLNAIATATSGEADLSRLLGIALEHLSRAIPFTGGSIALVEGDELVIRAAMGPFASIALGQRLRRNNNPSWQVVETLQPFLSNNLEASRLSATTPIQSYLAVPLIWRGRAIGLLEVDSTRPGTFADSDLVLVQKVATLLSGSVEVARQYAAEQRARAEAENARQRLAFLAEASILLASSLSSDHTFQSVARLAVPRLADYCSIFMINDDSQLQAVAHAHAHPGLEERLRELAGLYLPPPDQSRSLLAKALRDAQPVLIPQVTPDAFDHLPAESDVWQRLAELQPRSLLIVPLAARDRTLGVLALAYSTSGRRYTVEDLALVEELGRRAAVAVDNARLYAEARTLNAELEQRVQARTAELEAATDEIRRNERLLTTAQKLAQLGSWQWDISSNTISWSDELYRIYGRTRENFTATYEAYLDCVHPDDRELVHQTVRRAYEDHQPFVFDHRIVRLDGTVRSLHARGEVTVGADGQPRSMTGVALDITERKQIEDELRRSHEELRRLSEHLQAAREEERKRIAREIHDELGGMMTSLKMEVSRLAKLSPTVTSEALLERTTAMTRLIENTVKTIRRIATDLRPAVLDDLGLMAAIEWQLHEFEKRSGIQCHLASEFEDLVLSADGSTAIFRVFQETLTNVARHAQATRVEVNLEHHGDYLVLRVQDNGRGISERELKGTRSLGLVGMRERVRLLSGELQISGQPGQGTTVLVKIPLDQRQNGQANAVTEAGHPASA